jgi:acetoacetate decarboxylase
LEELMSDTEKHPKPVVISVDTRDVEVPDADVTGLQIKQVADIPEDVELFDHKGQPVADTETIRVHAGEKFTAISAPVVISVNNKHVEVPGADVTGLQIKEAAKVPGDFQLFDHKGAPVADEEHIRVHKGEKFTAISGQDVS